MQTLLKAPTRDNLEDELALRKRLSAMDPTLTDPDILAELETKLVRADLMNPNNREVLLRGEGTALAPSDKTDGLTIAQKNALFAARQRFPDVPKGGARTELELLSDSFGGVFTDEELTAIQAGADPFRFVTDLDPEQQEELLNFSLKIADSMSEDELKDSLFLSSGTLNGLPRDQRKLLLAYLKNSGGTITPQSLVNLGIYPQSEVKRGHVSDFADELMMEYAFTRNGTSLTQLHYADMQNRAM